MVPVTAMFHQCQKAGSENTDETHNEEFISSILKDQRCNLENPVILIAFGGIATGKTTARELIVAKLAPDIESIEQALVMGVDELVELIPEYANAKENGPTSVAVKTGVEHKHQDYAGKFGTIIEPSVESYEYSADTTYTVKIEGLDETISICGANIEGMKNVAYMKYRDMAKQMQRDISRRAIQNRTHLIFEWTNEGILCSL